MSELVARLRLAASDLTATMLDLQRIAMAPVLAAQQEATIRVLVDADAEIERLREVHLRGCECSVTEACQLLRERDAAVALLRECRPAVEWAREFCIDRMDSERRDTWEAVLDRLDAFLAGEVSR